MTTTTSQIRSVITDLHTLLEARGGLADVRVFRYAPSPRAVEGLREWVIIATKVTGTQDFPLLTTYVKHDEFTLSGSIFVEQPGAGDDVADAAHERAEALLAEIEDAIREDPSVGHSQNTIVKLTDYEHMYGADDRGRMHSLTYQLACTTTMYST